MRNVHVAARPHILFPMSALYDRDILLWSEQQADLLRRLSRGERVNDSLDWPNLIDEVESVGRDEFQAVESLLRVALLHLLLARYGRAEQPRGHWIAEALGALDEATRRFAPSMAQRLDLPRAWRLACRQADAKLAADGGPVAPFPAESPFALTDLIGPEPEAASLLSRLPVGGATP